MRLGIRIMKKALLVVLPTALLLAACEPTVRIAPPTEPITINLNIKLDAEIRVKLDETAKKDIKNNPDIF